MSFINLGYVKALTEYYSIFESLTLIYFAGFLLSNSLNKRSSVQLSLRGSVLLCFVACLLANYWAAGQAKLLLNGGVFSWLENETIFSQMRASFTGISVISIDSLLQENWLLLLEVLGNSIVLLTQLISPLSVIFFPFIIILLIIFEISHILIGLVAGVWFYKWMWASAVVIFYWKDLVKVFRYRTNLKVRILLAIFISLSPYFLTVVPLGWYETRQGDLMQAYGIKDSASTKLHMQFFGSAGYHVFQGSKNAYEYNALGGYHATEAYERKQISAKCGFLRSQNLDFKEVERLKLQNLTQRLLEERHWISKLMISIQPYHILIPNPELDNSILGQTYESVLYTNTSICFNRKGKVIKYEELDSFKVDKRNKKTNQIEFYISILEEKAERLTKEKYWAAKPINWIIINMKKLIEPEKVS